MLNGIKQALYWRRARRRHERRTGRKLTAGERMHERASRRRNH